jgi:hypothetical protein
MTRWKRRSDRSGRAPLPSPGRPPVAGRSELRRFWAAIASGVSSEDAADRAALAAFYKWAGNEGYQVLPLGFPRPWKEHESVNHEPEIYTRFRCVDCGKDTGGETGEYYMVRDDVWAASGLTPNGGMLCLACLERRIKRPLTDKDFTALWPSASAWQRHIAARVGCADPGPPEQLEIFPAPDALPSTAAH